MQRKVVFSTKRIEEINKLLDEGVIPKGYENPYADNILGVRKPDITFAMTKDEQDEYIKSAIDVTYFSKYCSVKQEDGRYKPIKLREYQYDIINMYQKNKYSILLSSRQIGKCVEFDTDVFIEGVGSVKVYDLWYKSIGKTYLIGRLKYMIYKMIDKLKNIKYGSISRKIDE